MKVRGLTLTNLHTYTPGLQSSEEEERRNDAFPVWMGAVQSQRLAVEMEDSFPVQQQGRREEQLRCPRPSTREETPSSRFLQANRRTSDGVFHRLDFS